MEDKELSVERLFGKFLFSNLNVYSVYFVMHFVIFKLSQKIFSGLINICIQLLL